MGQIGLMIPIARIVVMISLLIDVSPVPHVMIVVVTFMAVAMLVDPFVVWMNDATRYTDRTETTQAHHPDKRPPPH
jgi:hypothetical protein